MKILISTKETQGQRTNDFNYTDPEEPLRFGTDCSHESIDGGCGCRRSMVGAKTHTATTTMKVIESPYTTEEYVRLIKRSITESWGTISDDTIKDTIQELIRIAHSFEIGSIIERRGDTFQVREVTQ